MTKEHAGGVHTGLFKIPAEWANDQRTAVRIEYFDFDSLDTIDDLIREELARKGTVRALFKQILACEIAKARSEAAVKVLSHIIEEEDSGLAACQLAFACGMTILMKKTMTEVAASYGISKEAMQQGVDRRCEDLGLRKTRTMRDDDARQLMSLSNFRPGERK